MWQTHEAAARAEQRPTEDGPETPSRRHGRLGLGPREALTGRGFIGHHVCSRFPINRFAISGADGFRSCDHQNKILKSIR